MIEARHIHIATGAMPAKLPIAGEDLLTSSDQFLELTELPRRIAFLGSGFISFEFAHVCAIAGGHVTMIEMLERPLAGFDPDLVSVLVEGTRALGIELHLQTKVQGVARVADCLVITADRPQGTHRFEADMVVHGAGRVPEIDDLDLERGGVDYGKRGVRVNEYLQSISNPAVYAAGDAADSGPMLTPVAEPRRTDCRNQSTRGEHAPNRVPARAERRLHSAAARLRGTAGSRGPGAGTALHDELRPNRRLVLITTSR